MVVFVGRWSIFGSGSLYVQNTYFYVLNNAKIAKIAVAQVPNFAKLAKLALTQVFNIFQILMKLALAKLNSHCSS
jgi:hypothetical protein